MVLGDVEYCRRGRSEIVVTVANDFVTSEVMYKTKQYTWLRSALSLGAASIFIAVVCSIFVLHPFAPSFPGAGLDASWLAVLAEMAARHARWGVDIAFTYGPAVPLTVTYFNAQYFNFTLPLLLAISLVHGINVASLLRLATQHSERPIFILAVVGYGLALVIQRQNVAWQLSDSFFFSFALVVFLLDLRRAASDRFSMVAAGLGAATMGLIALSKMSFGLLALPLFGLADIRSVLGRRLPLLLPFFIVGFLVSYVGYGQQLADLPAFLHAQSEVIAGYGEAMGVPGSRAEMMLFLGFAFALMAMVVLIEIKSGPVMPTSFVLALGIACFLTMIFKAGFIRHDVHSLIGWTSLGACGLLVALSRALPRAPREGMCLAAASFLVLGVIFPYLIVKLDHPRPSAADIGRTWRGWFDEGPREELAAIATFLANPIDFAAGLSDAERGAWQDVRDGHPLPKLAGGVDTITSEQSALIANGLDYHPRPSFQEYATYTAGLAAANASFYEGRGAPEWVLFAPESIDDRYPAFAEGALWPDLLRFYEPARLIGDDLALHRRSKPLDDPMGTIRTVPARFGQPVTIDEAGPIFARISVKPNFLGRLAAFVFRRPLLSMTLHLRNGEEQSFRFIPALGTQGFLLSPSMSQAADFAAIAAGGDALADREVLEVSIDGTPAARHFFRDAIEVELIPLHIGGTPDKGTIVDARSRSAARDQRSIAAPLAGASRERHGP